MTIFLALCLTAYYSAKIAQWLMNLGTHAPVIQQPLQKISE